MRTPMFEPRGFCRNPKSDRTWVLFAAIGALSGLKRDLATRFGVLFAGMGGFVSYNWCYVNWHNHTVCCTWGLLSWGIRNDQCSRARVGVFCGSGDIATTPNGLFDLSGVTTFSKYFACAPPRSSIALFLLNV